jgi:pentatricopeptide repeat protein
MQRQPQAAPNAVTYNTLISACAKAGLYAKAQQLHGQMQAAGVPDDVFTLTALITGELEGRCVLHSGAAIHRTCFRAFYLYLVT